MAKLPPSPDCLRCNPPEVPPKLAALNLRLERDLRAACEREASRHGLALSAWMRRVLADATKRAA